MDTDQLLAQQQAIWENVHRINMASLAIWLGLMIFTAWVVYMFYTCLRDIAGELRRFRIAYEHAQDLRYERHRSTPSDPREPGNPDARYMPK
jgi:hypothetical protein